MVQWIEEGYKPFMEIFTEFKDTIAFGDLRWIALPNRNEWAIPFCSLIIQPHQGLKTPIQRKISTENIKISQCPLNIKEIQNFLENARNGILIQDGETFKLNNPRQGENGLSRNPYSFYIPREASDEFGIEQPVAKLQFNYRWERDSKSERQREIADTEFTSGDLPFDGFRDLLRNFLFFYKYERTLSNLDFAETCVYFLLPIHFMATESRIDKDNLKIGVTCVKEISRDKISIGTLFHKSIFEIERGRIEFKPDKNISEKINPNNIEITYTQTGAEKIIWAILLLHHQNKLIDRLELYNSEFTAENPMILAHNSFGCRRSFEEHLKGNGEDKSRDFERAVGLLFNFLGFSATYYSPHAKIAYGIDEEVDIIAFDFQERRAVLIECITGPISKKQHLEKLARRTHELKLAVGEKISVLPVILTTVLREKISENDWNQASELGIAVGGSGEIELLLIWAKQGIGSSEVYKYLKTLIPPKPINSQGLRHI